MRPTNCSLCGLADGRHKLDCLNAPVAPSNCPSYAEVYAAYCALRDTVQGVIDGPPGPIPVEAVLSKRLGDTAFTYAVLDYQRAVEYLDESDTLHAAYEGRGERIAALERERDAYRDALEAASAALSDARNGLDLGLGCARDVENDRSPRAVEPRSRRQEAYLERARAAHRAVRRTLGLTGPETQAR